MVQKIVNCIVLISITFIACFVGVIIQTEWRNYLRRKERLNKFKKLRWGK